MERERAVAAARAAVGRDERRGFVIAGLVVALSVVAGVAVMIGISSGGGGDGASGMAGMPGMDHPAAQPEEPVASRMPASPTTAVPAEFSAVVREIDAVVAARMSASWRPGCPVGLEGLRLLEVSHRTRAGGEAVGEIVVSAEHAEVVVEVFRQLFEAGYPIERMRLIDEYGGDDEASMAANNTSGFNCRRSTGGSGWSEHAYGRAIDVNPVQNPYVSGTTVLPPAGADFVDRESPHPAVIRPDDVVVRAFRAAGWRWGGTWSASKDYQHFSSTGR